MSTQIENKAAAKAELSKHDLPKYETPRIQAMDEKDILNSFQITQSMGSWWTIPTC